LLIDKILKNKNLHIFSFADNKNQYDVLKGDVLSVVEVAGFGCASQYFNT